MSNVEDTGPVASKTSPDQPPSLQKGRSYTATSFVTDPIGSRDSRLARQGGSPGAQLSAAVSPGGSATMT
jgi:hypothetical protein